jgi:anaerobic selenocysteine-containing dehydrogenase
VPLRLNDTLRSGVVFLPKGLWRRHTSNGSVASALVPDAVSPISGGALFNDTWVEVAACP